jgi:hypothetical protein
MKRFSFLIMAVGFFRLHLRNTRPTVYISRTVA